MLVVLFRDFKKQENTQAKTKSLLNRKKMQPQFHTEEPGRNFFQNLNSRLPTAAAGPNQIQNIPGGVNPLQQMALNNAAIARMQAAANSNNNNNTANIASIAQSPPPYGPPIPAKPVDAMSAQSQQVAMLQQIQNSIQAIASNNGSLSNATTTGEEQEETLDQILASSNEGDNEELKEPAIREDPNEIKEIPMELVMENRLQQKEKMKSVKFDQDTGRRNQFYLGDSDSESQTFDSDDGEKSSNEEEE